VIVTCTNGGATDGPPPGCPLQPSTAAYKTKALRMRPRVQSGDALQPAPEGALYSAFANNDCVTTWHPHLLK